ncbi:VRR-NUC domain-containing protein [Jeongeupia naejangsanensis]|uniref:VRR-NUC domain-containing protein n=1 Tax=Jeongeupia naejangsanensis TaxID=613195 RepID=A0ABS2BGW4_9NEIS|nr:VRR-NUC domain-containing protein [Jeongeupia naejangsanensis]MBM3114853.1 VRR-NUC domain-containing protein [Jeongeupia naejangsanensis]
MNLLIAQIALDRKWAPNRRFVEGELHGYDAVMNAKSLSIAAAKLGVHSTCVRLERGSSPKAWRHPQTGIDTSVEKAVLGAYEADGWRGYAGEGGLLLNLIKAMSFTEVAVRNRSTYVEALYAQNVSFDEDRFEVAQLLACLANADRKQVLGNFTRMASREPATYRIDGYDFTQRSSMLDYFPELEAWMFEALLDVAGIPLLHAIASRFAQNPYEYRRGWPDITMWRDSELRFVEVKAPGDRIHASQKQIVEVFAKPLALNFWLVAAEEI